MSNIDGYTENPNAEQMLCDEIEALKAELEAARAQVQRVRNALDRSERWLNSQHPIFAAAVRREVNVIRSALDSAQCGVDPASGTTPVYLDSTR